MIFEGGQGLRRYLGRRGCDKNCNFLKGRDITDVMKTVVFTELGPS